MADVAGAGGPAKVSVVTPTFRRPDEVCLLLENLTRQTLLPFEVILVDGAPAEEGETEARVAAVAGRLPFPCRYLRHGGGTAIQRNAGSEVARGDFIAFIDDDIRLEPDFFRAILEVFAADQQRTVGGVVGFRTNDHITGDLPTRWRWYRKLRLLTTYEPGRYDYETGYPINVMMQPPFEGVREVDFMTTACAVWRREVLDSGLRFDPFFRDYGMLEDAHFSLRARAKWRLLQCGHARCLHLHSSGGRVNRKKLGYKCVVNYYYVFGDIVQPLTLRRKVRFWRYQTFELLRIGLSGIRRRRLEDFQDVLGRLEGILAVARGAARQRGMEIGGH